MLFVPYSVLEKVSYQRKLVTDPMNARQTKNANNQQFGYVK
jgi:hypothetical protein